MVHNINIVQLEINTNTLTQRLKPTKQKFRFTTAEVRMRKHKINDKLITFSYCTDKTPCGKTLHTHTYIQFT